MIQGETVTWRVNSVDEITENVNRTRFDVLFYSNLNFVGFIYCFKIFSFQKF